MKTLVDYINEGRKKKPVQLNLHEDDFVDLGLSVKWAKTNLGAIPSTTEGYKWFGDAYSWGMTKAFLTVEPDFEQHNDVGDLYEEIYGNEWRTGGEHTKYNKKDKQNVLKPEDDPVTVKLGKKYRMPTKEEVEELNKLPHKLVEHLFNNPVNGYVYARTEEELEQEFDDKTMLFIPVKGETGAPLSPISKTTYKYYNIDIWTSTLCNNTENAYYYSRNDIREETRFARNYVRAVTK